MQPKYYQNPTFQTKQLISALRSLAILAMLASSMLLGTAFAQTLQFKYTFGDGPGTTTTDDPSSTIYPVTLNMVSGAYPGTAVDLHGPAGSGVQNQGSCLNMTANNPAGNSGTEYYAATTANTALGTGLGTVSNFTATAWFKMNSLVTNNVNNACRFFLLATNTVTSNGGGNTIDMIINTGVSGQNNFPHNNFQMQLNGTIVPIPVYYDFPTNVWLFVAMTYDAVSGNVCAYFGTEASPAKLYTVHTVAGAVVYFGNSASLMLGNNLAGNRGFQGRIGEVRFYTGAADASLIENIRQQSTPLAITGLSPDGSVLQGGTNTLTFAATSANGVNSSGIQVLVNGTDVSSSPYIRYTPTAGGQIVTYTNLPVNPTLINQSILNGVNVTIKVTDAGGIVTSNSYVYDAFSPLNFSWECEDYDFGGGMFIDNPVYTFVGPGPNTYYQEQISYGTDPSYVNLTDANDNGNLAGPSRVYRDPSGNVETEYSLGSGNNGGQSISELMRQKILDAYAVTNIARDVNVGYFDGGTGSGLPNWMNYTRTYPSGTYNAYLRVANGGGTLGDSFDQIIGPVSTPTTTNNLGTFSYGNTGGWDTFAWVPLRDVNGNLVRVTVPGVNTLRLTAGSAGGGNINFMMLTPANTNLPVITGIYPNGTNMFQPASALTFTASSPAGVTINPAGISVKLTITTLLGNVTVTNLTTANGLVVGGTATSRNVSAPLATNQMYTAVISVTDVNGSPASSTVTFDTLNPLYTWEAEDYDYSDGQFFDNPQTNAYVGLSADPGVDSLTNADASLSYSYRGAGGLGDQPDSDSPPRSQYIGTGFTSYNVGWNDTGDWGNYTRIYPSGSYNMYIRAANGNAGGTQLDTVATVTSGVGTPTQTTTNLGTFTIPGNGNWQGYVWAPLRDANGNLVKVVLGGKSTLRVTANAGGGGNINFYALFPANTNVPVIVNLYPNGTSMFQRTNSLAFGVTSPVGVSTSSIVVTLNGVAVSNLVFSGSALSWNVSCPLQLDAPYTVTILVTDVLGNTATQSASFDTFSSAYYTWEGEDFDYGGGQFIDNPQTNAYYGLSAETDVDTHQVNFNPAQPYLYRTNSTGAPGQGNGMSTEINGDVPRNQYENPNISVYSGASTNDYSMGYFSGGTNTTSSWANYTRHYPAGSYNVYGRLAAGGGVPTELLLSQITSGLGTFNQTSNVLGSFTVQNTGWESYNFVPLRDNSGNLVKLTFNGSPETLQAQNPIGSGSDVNVNFFMLVPASGAFTITASTSSGNINISFPTISPLSYQLFYKSNLTDPAWIPIGSPLVGNGSIQSFNQPASGTKRFYLVQVQ